ncbi:MAG TPA: hypothetical protein VK902_01565 [Rubrobacter sp.]|jgi:hypothetical protein|nr:hypothetical protein [Rubrobacter sp.]
MTLVALGAPSGPVNLENPLLQELIGTGLEVRPKRAHRKNEYAELLLLEECYAHLVSFFEQTAV